MKTTFTKEEVVDFLNKSTTATKMISSLKGRVDHISRHCVVLNSSFTPVDDRLVPRIGM